MPDTITIPRSEYKHLRDTAKRFEEMRSKLAAELFPEFPEERLEEYAHPRRIRASYQRALKAYPRSA